MVSESRNKCGSVNATDALSGGSNSDSNSYVSVLTPESSPRVLNDVILKLRRGFDTPTNNLNCMISLKAAVVRVEDTTIVKAECRSVSLNKCCNRTIS